MKQAPIPVKPEGHQSPVYPMWLFVPGLLLIFALVIVNAGALLKQGNFAIGLHLFSVLLLAPTAGICSFMGFVLNERIPAKVRRKLVAMAHLVILGLSACLIADLISRAQSGHFL